MENPTLNRLPGSLPVRLSRRSTSRAATSPPPRRAHATAMSTLLETGAVQPRGAERLVVPIACHRALVGKASRTASETPSCHVTPSPLFQRKMPFTRSALSARRLVRALVRVDRYFASLSEPWTFWASVAMYSPRISRQRLMPSCWRLASPDKYSTPPPASASASRAVRARYSFRSLFTERDYSKPDRPPPPSPDSNWQSFRLHPPPSLCYNSLTNGD